MTWRLWALLLVAQSIWAGSYVAMKFAGDAMPVGAVVFFRYGIATAGFLLLLPFVGFPRLQKRDWLLVAALGAVNFALSPTLQVESLRYTQAADVAILIGLEPVLTVLLAALILREQVDKRIFGAMALGIAGVWVLSGVGAGADEAARNRLWGNLLFMASILCEAAVTVAGGRLSKRYPPFSTIALMKAFGFLTAAIVYGPVVVDVDPLAFGEKAWGSLIYLGLLSSLFTYGVWYWVIGRAPIHKLATSLFAQPVIGAALGWLILNEVLGVRIWVGGGLVLLALAWTQLVSKTEAVPTP